MNPAIVPPQHHEFFAVFFNHANSPHALLEDILARKHAPRQKKAGSRIDRLAILAERHGAVVSDR